MGRWGGDSQGRGERLVYYTHQQRDGGDARIGLLYFL